MRKLLLASAFASTLLAPIGAALAQAPASPHTLTGNMTIASDYRFRGISQTFGGDFKPGPAIQGGIDYSHASGIYIGNWNSNVSGNQYPNGSSIEMDFYGGWKQTWGDFGVDVGTIYYFYPGRTKYPVADAAGNAYFERVKNWEVYVGGSWKWFSAKYYYSLTDYFGLTADAINTFVACNPNEPGCTPLARNGNTKGTQYATASFNYEVMPKLTLGASIGYTWVKHYSKLNYLDYKLGVTYDLNGWLLGAAFVGTDADKKYWYALNGEGKVREIGEPTVVLSVGKTF
jgi:uncharacterized protein (TIGR02001 family)